MSELKTTPLNRVTVSRLSSMTGISRQGFYYHFSDVYDLAVWNFKTQVTQRVKSYATYSSWTTCIIQMMEWMQEHEVECYRVIEAMPPGDFEHFLFNELRELMTAVLEDLEPSIRPEDRCVTDRDRNFVIDHFALTIQAHIMHWLSNHMPEEPSFMVPRIQQMIKGGVARALKSFSDRPTPTSARLVSAPVATEGLGDDDGDAATSPARTSVRAHGLTTD